MSTSIESVSSVTPFDSILLLRQENSGSEKKPADTSTTEAPRDWVTIGKDGRTYAGTESNNLANVTPGSRPDPFLLQESNTLTATTATGTQVTTTRVPAPAATASDAPATDATATDATAIAEEAAESAETAPVYSAQIARADGGSLSIDFRDNVRIHEQEKGRTSVYFTESNRTRTYEADGTFSETEGDTIAKDAGSIYINTRAAALVTGDGDNVVFNWADNADITTGSGNDTIVLRDNANGDVIHAGAGSDTVIGKQVTGSTIDLGEGDNTLDLYGMSQSQVRAGDGNNNVTVKHHAGQHFYTGSSSFIASTVEFGNGNNSFALGGVSGNSHIVGGNGANSFQSGQITGNSSLNLGDGNNSVKLNKLGDNDQSAFLASFGSGLENNRPDLTGYGTVHLGNGDNTVDVNEIVQSGSLTTGNGNNKATVYDVKKDGNVTTGNGNNLIFITSIHDDASLNVGHGDNTASIDGVYNNGSAEFGNGSNAVRISASRDNGNVSFGDGDNAVRVSLQNGESKIQLGEGRNHVSITEMKDQSELSMGDGDNLAMIRTLQDNANITPGKGNNLILVNQKQGEMELDKNIRLLAQLTDRDANDSIREYAIRVKQRTEQGLPTAASSLNQNPRPSFAASLEKQKRENDPDYIGDMKADERWKTLRQNMDFSQTNDILWMDAMRDSKPYEPLDTYA